MPTTASPAAIREEFDAMAPLMPHRLGPHAPWLLRGRERALEIGCGTGPLAARLAESFAHVEAIDFSPAMIAEARRRTSSINFACTDLFDWLHEHSAAYDCIVTISTLHR